MPLKGVRMFYSVFSPLPSWISCMRIIDPCDGWGWKWQLVALKSNPAQCRAIFKEKVDFSGLCPAVSWPSPKNASPRIELSLSQGCTIPPVDFFSPPYVQPAFSLPEISAIASWSFPGHVRDPASIYSLAGPGVKGSNYPPPSTALCAQLRHDITTLVGL